MFWDLPADLKHYYAKEWDLEKELFIQRKKTDDEPTAEELFQRFGVIIVMILMLLALCSNAMAFYCVSRVDTVRRVEVIPVPEHRIDIDTTGTGDDLISG
jgi:hypothetical protein